MHKADKIGALLRAAFNAGETEGGTQAGQSFEDWLADNGDEILAAVAELAQGVRAQEAAKVRGLADWPSWSGFRMRHKYDYEYPARNVLDAIARDIEDGTL